VREGEGLWRDGEDEPRRDGEGRQYGRTTLGQSSGQGVHSRRGELCRMKRCGRSKTVHTSH
jgi:hypothetical protein